MAAPDSKPSIEQRLAAALAPEPAPVTDSATPEVTHEETARQGVEREDAGAAEAAETEAGAAPGQPEAPGESADAGEGGGQEQEAVEIGTLGELAEHIGVDVGDLYGITVPITVDGKPVELPIGEWKDRVRAGVEADTVAEQRRAFAEEKKAAESQIATRRAEVEDSIRQAAALTESAEKQLLADIEGVNWAELRESQPAEWAAKQQEMQQRQAQIKESKQAAQAAWRQHVETQGAEHQAQIAEHIQRERDALLQAVPEWRDEGVFDSERKEMREYLSGVGFTDAEVDGATDHRLIVMARKARAYDEQQTKASVARKKVAKVGKKIIRPGSPASKQVAKDDAMTGMRKKLRKSGKVEDAYALIAAARKR